MKARKKMSKRHSKVYFSSTAGTHPKNNRPMVMRGGYRI